jgi:hypothetical protein
MEREVDSIDILMNGTMAIKVSALEIWITDEDNEILFISKIKGNERNVLEKIDKLHFHGYTEIQELKRKLRTHLMTAKLERV